MKKRVEPENIKLYLRIGIATVLLSIVVTLITAPGEFFERTGNHLWLMAYVTVVHFCLYEFAIPFIKSGRRRALTAPFLLALFIFMYTIGIYVWRGFGIIIHIYTEIKKFETTETALRYFTSYSISSLLFFGLLRHFYHYRKLKIAAQQMQIEKQEAELNYLKSQTNPHFLFNTLNNIYSLARDKSDLAPESILRLSKILRFMLYETGGPFIAIEQEVKIIDDYMLLEKLRYDESLQTRFNYNVEELKQNLPPLLLIPLVENAFKHGVAETRDQPFVDIQLSVLHKQLLFVVKNSIENPSIENPVKENIGLSNLRRQLELLYKEHQLTISQNQSVFTATLTINLETYVAH